MSNSLRLQKALTLVVAAATIIATAGLTAFVPSQASAASFGDLIKGETLSTVFYYGSDGQRYAFPNEKTYFSWFADFDDVVEISDAELADITLAGNIVYRAGSRWIKIISDEKVYAVSTDGTVHWIESAEVAEDLAGSDWNTNIDDVPDVYFTDYSVGDSLTSAASGYNGLLWTDGTSNYLVWDGEVRMVSSAGFSANGFQSGFVLDGSGFDMDSLTSGADLTSESASLTDAAQMVETVVFEESADVSVSISGSPAASTLIDDQGIADVLHVTLTNNSASSVNLNQLKVTRTGVSSDTTLRNLYLFDGWVRLTDAATVSSGVATFNDSTGLVSLAAGASKTLTVRADVGAGDGSTTTTSGQTVGLKIVSASDLSFSGSGTASGSFPLSGSVHTIASAPSTFGTASLGTATTTTPSAASIDPAEGIRVWERTLAVGTNEVDLYAARFRNIGSINAEDVSNWTLYVGGVARGSVVAEEDVDGYITFDLSGSPVALNTGNHIVKVMADVIGGSGRTVTVGLRNSADFIVIDQDYDQPVLPTGGAASGFAAMDAGAQTINSGSLTYTKATDSPSGDVVDTATGVTLGKWTVKAFGESMKVEKLRLAVDDSDNSTAFTLRNGAVYLNGAQIGSTAALAGISDSTLAYTEYTFGSSFVVVPGSPATLEVRADMVDSDGTDEVGSGDTFIARIVDMDGQSNVQRLTSGSYIDAPDGSAVTANTLTIATASLTVAKNGSYANQTTVKPKTAYKVGSFTVTAGTSEAVNLTDINVDFTTGADSTTASTDLFNLYVKYGPVNDMVTSSIKGSVTEASQSWSINYELGKGETIYVDVYADLDTAITVGETVIATLDVNGTTVSSSTTPTTALVGGQTITTAAGSFSEFNDDHPVAAAVAANQELTVAKYRFSAANESYTIKELKTSVASATAAGLVSSVRIYDGSTLVGSTVFDEDTNTSGTFTGLSIAVPADSSKTLTVKYVLTNVGTGAGTSQTNVINTLESVKIIDSNGTETTETGVGSADWAVDTIIGNAQYVFKSVPTISQVDLTNSTLVMGQATDLYKFTVTADSNGAIALKQFKLTVSWSNGGTVVGDSLEVESLKLYKNGSDITGSVVMQDEDGNSVESTSGLLGADTTTDEDLVVTWSTEDSIAAGETVTYTVRGTPQDFRQTGSDTVADSVSFYFAQDAAPSTDTITYLNVGTSVTSVIKLFTSAAAGSGSASAAEFIWSDNSASAHSSTAGTASTGDWHNGYLIKNLDLGSETWSK